MELVENAAEETPKAWLMKITVNCAYEQLWKGGRVVYTDQLEALEELPPPESETGLWDAVRAALFFQRSPSRPPCGSCWPTPWAASRPTPRR